MRIRDVLLFVVQLECPGRGEQDLARPRREGGCTLHQVRDFLYKNFVLFTWFDAEPEAGWQILATLSAPRKTLDRERGTRQGGAAERPVRKVVVREAKA